MGKDKTNKPYFERHHLRLLMLPLAKREHQHFDSKKSKLLEYDL